MWSLSKISFKKLKKKEARSVVFFYSLANQIKFYIHTQIFKTIYLFKKKKISIAASRYLAWKIAKVLTVW